jgi:hypothetical protein
MSSAVQVFIGWPNQGIDYWNGYWRRRADEGFFDDVWADEAKYDVKDVCTSCWYDNCGSCRSADCACRRHNHLRDNKTEGPK